MAALRLPGSLVAASGEFEAFVDAVLSEKAAADLDLALGDMVTLRHPIAQGIRNRLATFLTSLEVVQQRAARTVGELDVGYRSSPIVSEHRASLADLRIGDVGQRESPSLVEARDFGSGPRAGERAPDADLGGGRRLHEALWGTRHVALYFDGPDGSAEGYERMCELAAHLRERLGDRIAIRFVVPSDRIPDLLPDEDVWLDTEEWAHRRYGASAECLYVVRPDGYIGFRCQPVEREPLDRWIDSVFR